MGMFRDSKCSLESPADSICRTLHNCLLKKPSGPGKSGSLLEKVGLLAVVIVIILGTLRYYLSDTTWRLLSSAVGTLVGLLRAIARR